MLPLSFRTQLITSVGGPQSLSINLLKIAPARHRNLCPDTGPGPGRGVDRRGLFMLVVDNDKWQQLKPHDYNAHSQALILYFSRHGTLVSIASQTMPSNQISLSLRFIHDGQEPKKDWEGSPR